MTKSMIAELPTGAPGTLLSQEPVDTAITGARACESGTSPATSTASPPTR